MPGKPSIEEQSKRIAKRMAEEVPLKTAPEPQARRATVTLKISRTVRDHITTRTTLNEPIDRTLRRIFKLKIPVGLFPARTPRNPQRNPPSMTTIKVTEEVRDYITGKARWNESIDQTLRRLFNLPASDEAVTERRPR